jgi:hypothetical protein
VLGIWLSLITHLACLVFLSLPPSLSLCLLCPPLCASADPAHHSVVGLVLRVLPGGCHHPSERQLQHPEVPVHLARRPRERRGRRQYLPGGSPRPLLSRLVATTLFFAPAAGRIRRGQGTGRVFCAQWRSAARRGSRGLVVHCGMGIALPCLALPCLAVPSLPCLALYCIVFCCNTVYRVDLDI